MSNQLPISSQRLTKLRKSKGYTQNYVAKKIDVSVKTYRSWEIGYYKGNVQMFPKIDSDKLEMLSDLYNVSIDYILGRSDVTQIESSFIHNKIGLSENSINVLQENFMQHGHSHNLKYIEMIDFLLAHNETKNLLQNMYYYFFGNFQNIWNENSPDNNYSVTILDEYFSNGVSIDSKQIFVIFLSAITNALPNIKKDIVDDNPIYKNYGKESKTTTSLKNEIQRYEKFLKTTHTDTEKDMTLQLMYRQLEALEKLEKQGSDDS